MGEAIEWFQQTAARELPGATVMWDSALSVALIGSFLGAMATLARSVALFDLSGVAFMRAALPIVSNVAVAVLLWNLAEATRPGHMQFACAGLRLSGDLPGRAAARPGLSYLIASLANRGERTPPAAPAARRR